MIGYEEGDLDLEMMGCEGVGPIDEAILRAFEEIGSPFTVISSNECRDYSDHKHFWDAGLPAVLMIDSTEPDDYPWYHEPGDTIDKVNIPYLRSVLQLNTAAAALLTADPKS
jgi:hypothetical protein